MNYRPNSGLIIRVSVTCAVLVTVMLACSRVRTVAEELSSGTSSRQARMKALQSLPYQELNQQTQNKIRDILQKPSIYRRLPIKMIDIDPDYFVFLARHPEVVVNIWKIMGVTKMTTTRTGPFTVASNDGVGTISNVELVYGTSNLHIFYGEGTYEGPVLKRKLRGECVLVLNTSYQQSETGQPTATSQLDVFLKIENATASLIAKTLNPIVGSTADHNFVESLNFLQRLNETTVKNGVGVQRMANRLTDINYETRQEFVNIAGAVYARSNPTTTGSNGVPTPGDYAIPAYVTPAYPAIAYPSQSSLNREPTAPISATFGDPQYNYGQPATMNKEAAQAGYLDQPTRGLTYPAQPNQSGQGYENGYSQNGQYYQREPLPRRPFSATPDGSGGSHNLRRFSHPSNQAPQPPRSPYPTPPFQAPQYPPHNYYQR